MSETTRNTQIFACIARKGGVTKSTLTANIGAGLARLGYRVVVVESDGQGSLSKLIGIQSHNGFYDLIAGDKEFTDVMVRVPEKFGGRLIAKNGGELLLISSADQQMFLSSWEETGDRVYGRFQEMRGWADFVLVDTSPAIDEINNAWFYTADKLILPTLCERLSVDHLRDATMKYIRQAQAKGAEAGVPVATIHGIVPNRYDKVTHVDRINVGILQGRHGDEFKIFPIICNAAAWKTAAQLSMSIFALGEDKQENWRRQARVASSEIIPVIESMRLGVEAQTA